MRNQLWIYHLINPKHEFSSLKRGIVIIKPIAEDNMKKKKKPKLHRKYSSLKTSLIFMIPKL